MSHMVSQVLQELAGTEPAGEAYLEIEANYSKADLRGNCIIFFCLLLLFVM